MDIKLLLLVNVPAHKYFGPVSTGKIAKGEHKLKIGISRIPLSLAVLALFALAATPALHASSACPTPVSSNVALDGSSGGLGLDPGYATIATSGAANASCNVLITFNANGSITTTNPNGAVSYDSGLDDNVVGVVNNTGSALTALNLSSSTFHIFGFDGDGICGGYNFVSPGPNCGANQGNPNDYNPAGVSFSNIAGNTMSGTVNFLNGGIAANGGTGFFSLEDPVDLNLTVTAATPEPGTLLMMGTGIAGFAGLLRRKFNK
jgi:hypothetical protein